MADVSAGRTHFVSLLFLAVVVVIAFLDIVFLGKTFSSAVSAGLGANGFEPPTGYQGQGQFDLYRLDRGASAWQFEPWAEVTSRIMRRGDMPLWNPYQGAGAPHAANMQSAPFDLFLLPVNLHPTPLTWDVTFLLSYLGGAFAMYFWCRSEGLRGLPSVAGAVAFTLSGYFLLYSNNHFFRPYLLLPLLLLLVVSVTSRRSWIPVVALGGAIASNILMGMPEASFFVLLTAAGYALYRVATGPGVGRFVAFFRLATSALIGILLSSPLLAVFLEYLRYGYHLHEPSSAIGLRADPGQFLVYWLSPFFNGPPLQPISGQAGTRNWAGFAVALLVVAALASPSVMRRHNGWYFAGAGLFFFYKGYGFPGSAFVGSLPVANRVDFVVFGLPLAASCLAYLAALGTQSLSLGALQRRLWLLLLGAFLLGLYLVGNAQFPIFKEIIRQDAVDSIRYLILGAVAVILILVACLISKTAAPWISTAVVVLELMVLVPRGHYANRHDPFTRPSWAPLVASGLSEGQWRVFGLDAKLFPNTAAALGLHDIRVLDALYVSRYVTFLRTFIEPQFKDRFVGGAHASEESSSPNYEDNLMFDLLGVRYVLSGVNGTVPSSAGNSGDQFSFIGSAEGVKVFENRHRIPRTFLVRRVAFVRDVGEAVEFFEANEPRFEDGAVRVESFDPRTQVVLEAGSADRERLTSLLRNADPVSETEEARIVSYKEGEVVVRVKSAGPALLVLTDTHYPGWRAQVNGKNAKIFPVDIAFRGVEVPAGRSLVVFEYRPATFRLGLGGAAVGILLGLVALLLPQGLTRLRRNIG